MNILPVLFQNKTYTPQKNLSNNTYVIQPKYAHTLDHDTVSFTAAKKSKEIKEINKNKVKNEESKEVSMKLCSDIYDEAQRPTRDLLTMLRREMKSLIATEAHPEIQFREAQTE